MTFHKGVRRKVHKLKWILIFMGKIILSQHYTFSNCYATGNDYIYN